VITECLGAKEVGIFIRKFKARKQFLQRLYEAPEIHMQAGEAEYGEAPPEQNKWSTHEVPIARMACANLLCSKVCLAFVHHFAPWLWAWGVDQVDRFVVHSSGVGQNRGNSSIYLISRVALSLDKF